MTKLNILLVDNKTIQSRILMLKMYINWQIKPYNVIWFKPEYSSGYSKRVFQQKKDAELKIMKGLVNKFLNEIDASKYIIVINNINIWVSIYEKLHWLKLLFLFSYIW